MLTWSFNENYFNLSPLLLSKNNKPLSSDYRAAFRITLYASHVWYVTINQPLSEYSASSRFGSWGKNMTWHSFFFACLFPLQIKPLALRPVKFSEGEVVQELSRPHRSNSKEHLSEVSPQTRPFPFPLTSYGEPGYPLSQANAGAPLRWDTENKQTTATCRLRSEGSWCRSSRCFQLPPHKSAVCWRKKKKKITRWLAAHGQEMIRLVTQHHLL